MQANVFHSEPNDVSNNEGDSRWQPSSKQSKSLVTMLRVVTPDGRQPVCEQRERPGLLEKQTVPVCQLCRDGQLRFSAAGEDQQHRQARSQKYDCVWLGNKIGIPRRPLDLIESVPAY